MYWKDRLQRVQAMGLNTIEVSLVLLTQPSPALILQLGFWRALHNQSALLMLISLNF